MGKNLKFGISVNANDSLRGTVEKAKVAESSGLDYVWVSDSTVQLYAPIVAAAIASHTTRIRLGLGLMSPLLHDPQQIANSLITLCKEYGTRFDLCIGTGDRSQLFRAGLDLGNTLSLPAAIDKARTAIASEIRHAHLKTRIWLGAQGPKMLRIASNFDGILLNYSNPEMIRWAITRGKLRAGPKFTVGISAPSYVHSTMRSDIFELAKVASAIVALGTTRSVLRRMGILDEIDLLREKADRSPSLEEISSEIPSQIASDFSITKKPNDLPSYIQELSRLGVRHAVFGYPQCHSVETVKELADALARIR